VVDQYRVARRIGPWDKSYTLGGTRFLEDEDDDEYEDDCDLVPTESKRALLVSSGCLGVLGSRPLSRLLVDRGDNERDLAFWGMGSEVFSNC
jgi:hypothetical protein